MTTVGILAIQGDFLEHRQMLGRIDNVETAEIRLPQQLDDIDGLIIPGGESTTIAQLIDIYGFRDVLRERASEGMPVWGTCAGMIVMAERLLDPRPEPLGLMDIRGEPQRLRASARQLRNRPDSQERGRAPVSGRIHSRSRGNGRWKRGRRAGET